MMHMTAIQSFNDVNMVKLDLFAGILGLLLFTNLKGAPRMHSGLFPLVFFVLGARLIVDYIYHTAVSATNMFGGSTEEFVYSSIVWVALVYFYLRAMGGVLLLSADIAALYMTSVLAMMAIAKVTGWG